MGRNANICNLTINAPQIVLHSSNSYVGALAATTAYDTISNVKVYGFKLDDPTGKVITNAGSIVGHAVSNTALYSCLAKDFAFNLPSSNRVGGLAGVMMSNGMVRNCAAYGSIVANREVGGIAGSAQNGSEVHDSHARVDIQGQRNIGGIVGQSARGKIIHCYA